MLPSTSCGSLFWVGAVLMLVSVGMLPLILKQRRSPAAAGDGRSSRDSARWLTMGAALLFAIGITLAATTMFNGDCVEIRGACPSPMTGTGGICSAEGAFCRGGIFGGSGKCVTESSSIFNCECQCR
jgi:hypothetical protein